MPIQGEYRGNHCKAYMLESRVIEDIRKLLDTESSALKGGVLGRITAKGMILSLEQYIGKTDMTSKDVVRRGIPKNYWIMFVHGLVYDARKSEPSVFESLTPLEVLEKTVNCTWNTWYREKSRSSYNTDCDPLSYRNTKSSTEKCYDDILGDRNTKSHTQSESTGNYDATKFYQGMVDKFIAEERSKGYSLAEQIESNNAMLELVNKNENAPLYEYLTYVATYLKELYESEVEGTYKKICKQVISECKFGNIPKEQIFKVYTKSKLGNYCTFEGINCTDEFYTYFTNCLCSYFGISRDSSANNSSNQGNAGSNRSSNTNQSTNSNRGSSSNTYSSASADDLSKYYKVLDLTPSATINEVRKQYKVLLLKFHPDTLASKDLPKEFIDFANAKVIEIQEAYNKIKAVSKQ